MVRPKVAGDARATGARITVATTGPGGGGFALSPDERTLLGVLVAGGTPPMSVEPGRQDRAAEGIALASRPRHAPLAS